MSDISGKPPRISVLTPVLNEAEHLPAMLQAMRTQVECGEVEFLLIDGGSADATEEIVREAAAEDPRVMLLRNPERRTPNALNIGLHAARGDFVARMDAHTLYPPDYLARGMERLEIGGVAWVSGPQVPRGMGTWSRRIALALGSPIGVGGAGFRSKLKEEIEVDSGFTGVWRRSTLMDLDGWDEDWPINQDGELAGRIREQGGRIVCIPQMTAEYVPRDSIHSLARQYWRYGQYKAKTCRRHPDSLRRSHPLPPGVVIVATVALFDGPLRKVSRAALCFYAATLTAGTIRAAPGESLRDRVGVATALVTMHFAWGSGFLRGCARFGVPIRAFSQLFSRNGNPPQASA